MPSYLENLNQFIRQHDFLKVPEAERAVVCLSPNGAFSTAASSACDELRQGGSLAESFRRPIDNVHYAFEYIQSAETTAEKRQRIFEVARDTVMLMLEQVSLVVLWLRKSLITIDYVVLMMIIVEDIKLLILITLNIC